MVLETVALDDLRDRPAKGFDDALARLARAGARIERGVFPELPEAIAEQMIKTVRVLRGMQLKKLPSVAETIDWGRTLLALGMDTLDDDAVRSTLGVVLKHQSDQVRAAAELRLN